MTTNTSAAGGAAPRRRPTHWLGVGGAAGAGGGIAPGELTVTARVQVTFDVA